jgi:S1-C subfamily serine protease
MTSRRRTITIALVIALLLTITCTAWAKGRALLEPKAATARHAPDLKVVIDGTVVTGASVTWDDDTSTLTITRSAAEQAVSPVEAGDKVTSPSQLTQGESPSTTDAPTPGKDGSPTLDLKGVIAAASPSVVLIETYDANGFGISQGSGVVVGRNMIVTNLHVIEDASEVKATDSTGKVYVCNGTLAKDGGHDLAILDCTVPLEPIQLGNSDVVAIGDSVVAIGNPRGLQGTVSNGIVSGLRQFGKANYIQTTAPTSHGSSGGGLFAMDASLIGITTLIYENSQNLSLVVPVKYVEALVSTAAAQK